MINLFRRLNYFYKLVKLNLIKNIGIVTWNKIYLYIRKLIVSDSFKFGYFSFSLFLDVAI